jgi:hypothetical protein
VAIENRTLTPGTQLTATYKKVTYFCTVEQAEDGKLSFVLADGRRFTSPSAAGSALLGGIACNGWRYWSLAGDAAPTDAPDATDASAAEKPRRTRNAKLLSRIPNQRGAPEGLTRWWCSGCMAGFTHLTGETPTACPQGHSETPAA